MPTAREIKVEFDLDEVVFRSEELTKLRFTSCERGFLEIYEKLLARFDRAARCKESDELAVLVGDDSYFMFMVGEDEKESFNRGFKGLLKQHTRGILQT